MKLRLALFLLLVGMGTYGTCRYLTGWQWQFTQSPTLVFYTLHDNFMLTSDHPVSITKVPGFVMDRVAISDPTGKAELMNAAKQALSPVGMTSMSSCFNPHHAVSTADGQTTILLCFECGQARVITPRGRYMVPINRHNCPLFDSLVRKYNLKTDPLAAN